MSKRPFFVGGNFKLNPTTQAAQGSLLQSLAGAKLQGGVEVVIAPSPIYLFSAVQALAGASVKVAAQNCHLKLSGAFTGEISPTQLVDAGIPYVILGHSERRTLFGETSEVVASKTKVALDTGLSIILCIGETLEEREAGTTNAVVQAQLDPVIKLLTPDDWSKVVVAYEPVWAIGTGKVATPDQAQDVHAVIRDYLKTQISQAVSDATRVIYGGSVTASNCRVLAKQKDIDGFLVGGASLKPEFVDIINVDQAKE